MSYAEAYQRARQDADGFWAEQARAVAPAKAVSEARATPHERAAAAGWPRGVE